MLRPASLSVISHKSILKQTMYFVQGVIDKFVSFFHRIIIYGWIYIIFCHYQQQSVVIWKKKLKCKLRQTSDVTMM